jgi:hypothetical protein
MNNGEREREGRTKNEAEKEIVSKGTDRALLCIEGGSGRLERGVERARVGALVALDMVVAVYLGRLLVTLLKSATSSVLVVMVIADVVASGSGRGLPLVGLPGSDLRGDREGRSVRTG